MKTFTIRLLILFIIFALNSCEKVIELELKDTAQKTVVEAKISNNLGGNYVLLSKSSNFYELNDFEVITNATVTIYDNTGKTYILSEKEAGFYQNDTLIGEAQKTYFLKIVLNDKTITSKSFMPNTIIIDSLTSEKVENPFGGGGEGNIPRYKVSCNFTDPANTVNFYRLKTYVNGFDGNDIYVFDDALFNGSSISMPIRMEHFTNGDTIDMELISIDRANYEYYRLLSENGMSSMSTSVGNPVSNVIGENVIGLFGANSIDKKRLIIE